jgi:PilZ domain
MPQPSTRSKPSHRNGDRAPLHARIVLTGSDGRRLAPDAVCTNIGLGGLGVRAHEALEPGTTVQVEIRLVGGRLLTSPGHVCWSRITLYPALLGTPKGAPEDASFGICFDGASTQDLLPIARLLVAREESQRRARRIRRLHGLHLRA